jgi:hypothetical protein
VIDIDALSDSPGRIMRRPERSRASPSKAGAFGHAVWGSTHRLAAGVWTTSVDGDGSHEMVSSRSGQRSTAGERAAR